MHKRLFRVFSSITILAMMMALPAQSAGAAATVIAQWNFESPNPADATDLAVYPNSVAPAIGAGNAGGVHASALTDWTTPVGNGSADSFSSNNWGIGDYYEFSTSTLNYTGIQLSWDQTRSSTGPSDFKVAYSTNGTTFTDFDTYVIAALTWSSGSPVSGSVFSRDLSAVTALNNQANVYFRLIATSAASGTAGSNRIDNFTVSGTMSGDAAPFVADTTPANGDTGVAVGTNITVNFSEAVNVAANAITVECPAGNLVAGNAFSANVTSVVIDPASDLPLSTTCEINVSAAGVTDVDANDPPDAMDADFAASFTTTSPIPSPGDVVISEVYGGGGNSGATYTNDFIELYNRTGSSISLAGWSVQYASSAGSTWQVTSLSGSIGPGKYYLVQEAAGAGGTTPLPTPDATGSIAMSASSGKVALVQNSTALSGTCPTGSSISDFVGYGAANCFEGSAAAPGLSNTTSAIRANGGATDTDDNAADFSQGAPNPQNSVDPAPAVSSTFPTNGATNFPINGNLTVNFSEPVNVTSSWFTLVCSVSGNVSTTFSGGPLTFTLDPDVSLVDGENCTLTVLADQVSDMDTDDPPDNMVMNFTVGFTSFDICAAAYTPIYDIQGSGPSAAISGTVITKGVVVGDFEGSDSIGGFFIQDPTGDGDAGTSDGIFVYTGNANLASVGQLVTVTGYARERFNQTALNGSNNNNDPVTIVANCGTGSVAPTDVTLPFADADYPERYEGMYVRLPQALVISEYFNYDRFGEIVLAQPLPGESRPFTGTAIDEPGAPANVRTLANSLSRITLDDANSSQNPAVLRHPNGLPFSLTNRFRGGDTVKNTIGVLGYDFSLYRIFPTGPADYTAVNPRPAASDPVGGSLRISAMNTLNFFVTPDYPNSPPNPLDNKCGPLNDVECRGWDSDQPDEFTRQRTKLLAALSGLNADIIGLNELENSTGVEPLESIVSGLSGYDYIHTGTIGTDAIKVGLIYRSAAVTPLGSYQILDSTVDPRFIDTKNRPSLAQTFEVNATGARFTVVVNHLKSKGSDCLDVNDPDTGDGQGNCSQTRKAAAQALVDWIATDPTGSGDADYIIMGDLNSYAQEDTIDVIKAGPDGIVGTGDDYSNLIYQYQGTYAYSYVFDGQFGYLDHALSNSTLTPQITGAEDWHINSDEPDVFDYDTTFKSPEEDALYEPNAYRSSDHDPVVVGLDPLHYDFTGFFQPIDNAPAFNKVKAGSSVPVKFSLNGDQGLDILFNGYPQSQEISCDTSDPVSGFEQTATAGGSSLTYDPLTDQYNYVWKTDDAWGGTCRQLVVVLKDGSVHMANFQFK